MGQSIFNIQQEYLDLLNNIDENDGEITSEIEEQLAVNIDNFEDKMRNYRYLIADIESKSTMIDDELNRLKALKETKVNLIKRLKTVMRDAVLLYGDTGKSGNKVLDLGDIKFYTRKNEVIKINNLDLFIARHDKYVRCEITEKFDKAQLIKLMKAIKEVKGNDEVVKYNAELNKSKIKKDLKDKVEIDGAILIRDDNLMIK